MIDRLPPLVVVLVAALMTGQAGPGTGLASPQPEVVIHESMWDPGERDSWSAFTVRLSSAPGAEFRGELRLVPAPVDQLGSEVSGQGTDAPELAAPSIRAPLTLDPGLERSVSVMVPVGDAAYRAEVLDVNGRMVSAGQPLRALRPGAFNIGLLTDRPGGDSLLQVGPELALNISRRFRSARDFPSEVLSLAGLEVIVIGDFDSATLSSDQRQALQDFVSLGGALVLTGGASVERTMAPLPDALVPLLPKATAVASLAPLAELVRETTDVVAPVATGDMRTGRVVLGGVHGPPLVIEASYGWGRIVQLTYDPFDLVAHQPPVARSLPALPWTVAFGRVRPAAVAVGPVPAAPAVDVPAPAWSILDEWPGPVPASGGPVGLLLLGYPVMIGAAIFFLRRARARAAGLWLAVPALAAIVAVVTVFAEWGLRGSPLTGDELTIERVGANSAQMESYQRLVPSGRSDAVLTLADGALASTGAAPRRPRVLPALPPEPGAPVGPGNDLVALGGDTQVVFRHLVGWDVRRLHTLVVSDPGGSLDARLRLRGGRLVGTVTNHGERPVRRLRVQGGDGSGAVLAAVVRPGETASVDVALAAPPDPAAAPESAGIEEAVLDTAAASAANATGPGELALVGLVPASPPAEGPVRRHGAHRAVVSTVALEAADDFVLGFGAPLSVCCGFAGPGIFELLLPTGMAGPFSLEHTAPVDAEIYDWTAGTWRRLPFEQQGKLAIEPAEIRDGFVQLRAVAVALQGAGVRAVAAG